MAATATMKAFEFVYALLSTNGLIDATDPAKSVRLRLELMCLLKCIRQGSESEIKNLSNDLLLLCYACQNHSMLQQTGYYLTEQSELDIMYQMIFTQLLTQLPAETELSVQTGNNFRHHLTTLAINGAMMSMCVRIDDAHNMILPNHAMVIKLINLQYITTLQAINIWNSYEPICTMYHNGRVKLLCRTKDQVMWYMLYSLQRKPLDPIDLSSIVICSQPHQGINMVLQGMGNSNANNANNANSANITHLELNYCTIDSSAFYDVGLPHLTTLVLRHCIINEEGLMGLLAVLEYCPDISSITITDSFEDNLYTEAIVLKLICFIVKMNLAEFDLGNNSFAQRSMHLFKYARHLTCTTMLQQFL